MSQTKAIDLPLDAQTRQQIDNKSSFGPSPQNNRPKSRFHLHCWSAPATGSTRWPQPPVDSRQLCRRAPQTWAFSCEMPQLGRETSGRAKNATSRLSFTFYRFRAFLTISIYSRRSFRTCHRLDREKFRDIFISEKFFSNKLRKQCIIFAFNFWALFVFYLAFILIYLISIYANFLLYFYQSKFLIQEIIFHYSCLQ